MSFSFLVNFASRMPLHVPRGVQTLSAGVELFCQARRAAGISGLGSAENPAATRTAVARPPDRALPQFGPPGKYDPG